MTWLPWNPALVQHPSMTPELDTGLGSDITAATATLLPPARTTVVAVAAKMVRRFIAISSRSGPASRSKAERASGPHFPLRPAVRVAFQVSG